MAVAAGLTVTAIHVDHGLRTGSTAEAQVVRGFKGGPYKKVYKDYRTYAEQEINKDEIPDGYRFYVRRYFQLIRPRE